MSDSGTALVLACSQCDLLQQYDPGAAPRAVHCPRCHAVVLHAPHASVDRPLALAFACAQALLFANVFPLVSLDVRGDIVSTTLPRAAWMLYEHDMAALALLVLVTILLAPAIHIAAILVLMLYLRFKRGSQHIARLLRLVNTFGSWGMTDVLMLGILVSLVKLAAIAAVVPGVALWALAALIVLLALLSSSFNTHDLWRWSAEATQ